jgi:flagellar hook-associated protein 3 FlgL
MNEVDMTDILSKTENIDIAKTVMDLQMLEYIHRSALAVGARIIRPTLIDFLR